MSNPLCAHLSDQRDADGAAVACMRISVCVKPCTACADSCEQFSPDTAMQACAEACRDCASACREMLVHS